MGSRPRRVWTKSMIAHLMTKNPTTTPMIVRITFRVDVDMFAFA